MEIPNEARSIIDVENIMGYAKLNRSELLPTVQCLHFSSQLQNEELKLMEVNNEILKDIQEGQEVIMRGEKNDSAVLCTSNKTYDIKEAETSNKLLLVPDCQIGKEIEGVNEVTLKHVEVITMKQTYFELKEILPRLGRLSDMLHENVYSGKECEKDEYHQGKKYTLEDLKNSVQASTKQLFIALQKLKAVIIDGYVRIYELDFLGKVLQSIIDLIDEQSWNIDEIPICSCCDILEELYPRHVIGHVLQCYSVEVNEDYQNLLGPDTKCNKCYKLDEDKVCIYNAETILAPVEKWKLEEFLRVWQLAVPDGMTTALYQLEGLALIDTESNPRTIRYFPVSSLPEDTAQRFEKLFEAKAKWTLEEISPYIKDIATEKIGVSALLMRNARASTKNGIKMYNSKKLGIL